MNVEVNTEAFLFHSSFIVSSSVLDRFRKRANNVCVRPLNLITRKEDDSMSPKATGLILLACLFCLMCAVVTQAQSANSKQSSSSAQTDSALQELVNRAARDALSKFKDKNFQEGNLAITLIDLTDQQHPRQASFRGGEGIYPASV